MNLLRERLNTKKYLFGGGICMGDPQISEALGMIYDFLWIDMEHTGMSCDTVRKHLIAARASGCAAVVRIPWNDPVLAKPVLDMGPDGIVFPQVGGLADAERAVGACLYPPRGCRGWGPIRALSYGMEDGVQFRREENDLIFPILQVENQDFIRDMDEILKLDGIGAICAGPCDLSASVGRLGDFRTPEIRELFDRVGAAAENHEIPLMVSTGYDPAAIRAWAGRGARLFQVGSDYSYMVSEANHQIRELRSLLTDPERRGPCSASAGPGID